MRVVAFLLTSAVALAAGAQSAAAEGVRSGKFTIFKERSPGKIDYARAKPMPLPTIEKAPASQLELLTDSPNVTFEGEPKFYPDGEGDGVQTPVSLPTATVAQQSALLPPPPPEYGSSGQPYTTTQVKRASDDPNRRAGKLFFQSPDGASVCTGSLIQRGIVLTAAHCVAKFGTGQFFGSWEFVPAYRNGQAPFGIWTVRDAIVLNSYLHGTERCANPGVVCPNDVALLVLTPKQRKYPGDRTGWLGFGINGYSFNKQKQALITSLGYPVALNGGEIQMRTDSQGAVDNRQSKNTIIGSLQTGGSSGGPWIVNFGFSPKLQSDTKHGRDRSNNIAVGVTSWGYTDPSAQGPKQQGASPFTQSNIGDMFEQVCKTYRDAC